MVVIFLTLTWLPQSIINVISSYTGGPVSEYY